LGDSWHQLNRVVVSAALMPAVGSFKHKSSGSVASAMPISRLRCSPCDRLEASSSALRRGRPTPVLPPPLDDVAEAVVWRSMFSRGGAICAGDATFSNVVRSQDVGDLVGTRDARPRDQVGGLSGDVFAVSRMRPESDAARR